MRPIGIPPCLRRVTSRPLATEATEQMARELVTLYAKKKKEEKKKAGGTGWDTIRWKQDLLERTCVAMAVANFRLLDAHTRAP